MKITYIHHSSFLAELQEMAMLFDYFEGDIPPFDRKKPLVVFVSHRHGDHFSPVIFELAKQYENVKYVLSDDIWNCRVPEEMRARITFIGPGEERKLTEPELTVRAYQSTDEGVAFLIQAEGLSFYHGGDLNNWVWEGEPEEANQRMSQNYHKVLSEIAGHPIDIAFLPLDPRQEKDFYLGIDDFMKMVGANLVFPMHFWGDFGVIERLKALPAADYKDKIQVIRSRGERIEII